MTSEGKSEIQSCFLAAGLTMQNSYDQQLLRARNKQAEQGMV